MGTMQYSEVIYYVGDKVSVLGGYESMISTALLFGAKGAVMATANLFPQIFKKMINAAKNKDVDKVNKIHYELIRPLDNVIFAYPHPGPLRVALKHIGIDTGYSILPVKEPPIDFQKRIIEVVDDIQSKLDTF